MTRYQRDKLTSLQEQRQDWKRMSILCLIPSLILAYVFIFGHFTIMSGTDKQRFIALCLFVCSGCGFVGGNIGALVVLSFQKDIKRLAEETKPND